VNQQILVHEILKLNQFHLEITTLEEKINKNEEIYCLTSTKPLPLMFTLAAK